MMLLTFKFPLILLFIQDVRQKPGEWMSASDQMLLILCLISLTASPQRLWLGSRTDAATFCSQITASFLILVLVSFLSSGFCSTDTGESAEDEEQSQRQEIKGSTTTSPPTTSIPKSSPVSHKRKESEKSDFLSLFFLFSLFSLLFSWFSCFKMSSQGHRDDSDAHVSDCPFSPNDPFATNSSSCCFWCLLSHFSFLLLWLCSYSPSTMTLMPHEDGVGAEYIRYTYEQRERKCSDFLLHVRNCVAVVQDQQQNVTPCNNDVRRSRGAEIIPHSLCLSMWLRRWLFFFPLRLISHSTWTQETDQHMGENVAAGRLDFSDKKQWLKRRNKNRKHTIECPHGHETDGRDRKDQRFWAARTRDGWVSIGDAAAGGLLSSSSDGRAAWTRTGSWVHFFPQLIEQQ